MSRRLPVICPYGPQWARDCCSGSRGSTSAPDGSLRRPWMPDRNTVDEEGRPQLAGLGVLVDDVLGYAVNQVLGGWSCEHRALDRHDGRDPVGRGRRLCTGRVVHVDELGALATGEVSDHRREVVARCVLRGRVSLIVGPERGYSVELARQIRASRRGPARHRHVLGPDVRRARARAARADDRSVPQSVG